LVKPAHKSIKVKIDLKELEESNVISSEIAKSIQDYYHQKEGSSPNKLGLVFGILGALLVGLGVILIIAHNWDDLSRHMKTFLAFIPLTLGQVALGYSLFRKKESKTWPEASACFLIFAIGACISLVSQIYNIEGNLGSFLLTWSLLVLPIVYIARSSIASLLYIILITYYLLESDYGSYKKQFNLVYWLLFLAIVPHIFFLFKKRIETNFINFHSFLIPISLSIGVGALVGEFPQLLSIAFIALFSCFYGLGYIYKTPQQGHLSNGFILFGSMATMVLLLMSSFKDYWTIMKNVMWGTKVFQTETFYFALSFFVLALMIYFYYFKNKGKNWKVDLQPIMPVFIFFTAIVIIGQFFPHIAQILINLLILCIGVWTIRQGSSMNHLGILNYGLILISILVTCRFFDTDMSFVLRGLIFVGLGLGFFAANYWMIKKRKENG
jgi:uncharacterized membrane protein